MDKITKKTLSDTALLLRVRKYCALRERSIKEAKNKLYDLGVLDDKAQLIIEKLTTEGFLNEKKDMYQLLQEASSEIKNGGKKKIEMELKKQGIAGELLQKGLNELEQEDYLQVLDNLLIKKWKLLKAKSVNTDFSDDDLFTPAMQKLLNYATQKGFEYDLIIERVKKIL